MFNKKEYINDYIKDKYKTIKLRIRNDDKILIDKISNVDNINQYLIDLIIEDIIKTSSHNYINEEVIIDFELSKGMKDLVIKAEKADLMKDYGLYMNMADAIDTRAKLEVSRHIMTNSQWNTLIKRYVI